MPITREEALHILDLSDQFLPDQVDHAIDQRRVQIEQRIHSAPAEALKDKYRRQLQELDDAKAALLGSAPAPAGSPLSQTMLYDLPLAQASYTRVEGAMPSPGGSVMLKIGQTLGNGRYQIEEQIGSGGMGAVYRAFDRNRDKDIAIKVLLPSLVSQGKAKERFLQEARLSSEMSHPHIVTVFDVQQDGPHTFLTMELLKGQTLRNYLNNLKQLRKSMTVDEALKIIGHVCQGLAYAHDKGAVHRDIKPENIWLTETGQAKVMDFGIARLISTTQMTQTLMAIGTAYYMAPEQLQGLADIDGRADQYAVAIMLYEMLTGTIPTGRIESLHKVRKDIGKEISLSVDRTMSANRKQRFDDIGTFYSAVLGKSRRFVSPRVKKKLGWLGAGLVVVSLLFTTWPQWKGLIPDRKAEAAAKIEVARLEGEIIALLKQVQDKERNLQQDSQGQHREEGRLESKSRQAHNSDDLDRLQEALDEQRLKTQRSDELALRYHTELEAEGGLSALEGRLNAAKADLKANRLKNEANRVLQVTLNRLKTLKDLPQSLALSIKTAQAASQVNTLLPGQSFRDCSYCPEMVVIPSGKFLMGSPATEAGHSEIESLQHEVTIEQPFALGRYEVTRAQYKRFANATNRMAWPCQTLNGEEAINIKDTSYKNPPGLEQTDLHPVVCVSQTDAEAYARWLSDKTGKHYRLPTEAEWEYAARAGSQTSRYWGNDDQSACSYANVPDQVAIKGGWQLEKSFPCSDGYAGTAPVGSFRANGFGLYDILGNVWEWTCSAYWEYPYPGIKKACDYGGTSRELRGGSAIYGEARSAERASNDREYRENGIGFRLAQDR